MTVTSNPVSPIRPVGSDVTLTCTVELSPAVDVPVTVNVQLIDPAGRSLTISFVSVSSSIYASTATISSFGRNRSGVYTCTAFVSSTNIFLSDSDSQSGIARVTTGKAKATLQN